VGEQLQAHREEIAASHSIHSAVTKNAEQLAIALENLTSTTQAELQQINNATHSIRENLIVPRGREVRIWDTLLGAFRFAFRGTSRRKRSPRCLSPKFAGDLSGYHQVSEHLILRILTIAGRLVLSSAWFLLSAVMVMISFEPWPLADTIIRVRRYFH
jgi:hypothetical protein